MLKGGGFLGRGGQSNWGKSTASLSTRMRGVPSFEKRGKLTVIRIMNHHWVDENSVLFTRNVE